MIVVVGSRHDPVAIGLAAGLPRGALCGADDLTRPGWCWPLASPEGARWVVDGCTVDDRDVRGVIVRRNRVHPEELLATHADDREYLAAEATAFLGFVLSRTAARVVNRPVDGLLGDDALRPEQWMAAALRLGLAVAPLQMRSGGRLPAPGAAEPLEVAVGRAFGSGPPARHAAAVALAAELGLDFACLVFDGRGRLLALSTQGDPSLRARSALAAAFGAGP